MSHCGRGGPTTSPSGDGGVMKQSVSALLTASAAITFSALISRGRQEDLASEPHPVIMPAHADVRAWIGCDTLTGIRCYAADQPGG